MRYKFKRGQIVRATCDYTSNGSLVIFQDKTYVIIARSKNEYGQCYVTVVGVDNRVIDLHQDFFR